MAVVAEQLVDWMGCPLPSVAAATAVAVAVAGEAASVLGVVAAAVRESAVAVEVVATVESAGAWACRVRRIVVVVGNYR